MCECNFFRATKESNTLDTMIGPVTLLSTNCFMSALKAEPPSETVCILTSWLDFDS